MLLGAATGALALGVIAAAIAALVSGSAAGLGALVGTVIVVLVFVGGASVVNMVAGISPAASLMVALLTYLLQIVLMAVILFAISGSGLVPDVLNAYWLTGAIILGTLGWMVFQIILTTRLRLPAYDLTDASAR